MSDHEKWMRKAIEIAIENPKAPFGALLLDCKSNEVLATGLNQSGANPLLHGEIDAINNYANKGLADWENLCLYTTAEPCCMCQAGIIWAGIPTVVFGTSISTLNRLGWRQFDLTANDIVDNASFSNCKIIEGVLAGECDKLFRRAKDQ